MSQFFPISTNAGTNALLPLFWSQFSKKMLSKSQKLYVVFNSLHWQRWSQQKPFMLSRIGLLIRRGLKSGCTFLDSQYDAFNIIVYFHFYISRWCPEKWSQSQSFLSSCRNCNDDMILSIKENVTISLIWVESYALSSEKSMRNNIPRNILTYISWRYEKQQEIVICAN